MATHCPAEVFGFPVTNRSAEAQAIRERFWCPFVDDMCNKKSRLIDYPMGVCSVKVRENTVAICPRRFLQDHTVFHDIALDYFGSTGKLIDALNDFRSGQDVIGKNYGFGMNTYDTLKRSYTQILNKGVVMEQWEQRIYWVFQSPVFDNLCQRYQPGFSSGSDQTNVFVVYDL
ncbi:MAG TPA: hypothetical protein ENI37_08365, partial [Chloroflexi bacterium]|nr:hypothetical protein [Chloroflexota bacterium]